MNWIDTHTHLYSDRFKTDRKEVIERAIKGGVERFYLPNVDAESLPNLKTLFRSNPAVFFPMVGLHPCSVKEDFQKELDIVYAELIAGETPYVAIGEIGIDLYWDKSTLDIQIEAFEKQIEWALAFNLPIVIHARESFETLFSVIKKYDGRGLRAIFHCFTGDAAQAEFIYSRNMLLGIGGVATFKNGGLDKVLPHVPRESVVLETDAPYLAPVPYRGKRNESAYIPLIGQKIAEFWNCPVEEVAEITTKNAIRFFHP